MTSPDKQLLFGIFDHHFLLRYDDYEAPYRDKLQEIMLSRESNGGKEFHVLIEHEELLQGTGEDVCDLGYSLLPLIKKLKLQRTTAENFDQRNLSAIATSFFDQSQDPIGWKMLMEENERARQGSINRFGCLLNEITFEQIFDEWKTLTEQAEQLRSQWEDEVIKQEFSTLLDDSASAIRCVRATLNNCRIDLSSSALETSDDLHENRNIFVKEHGNSRDILHFLMGKIGDAGMYLTDCFLLDRLLKLRDPSKTIILFAGGYHVGNMVSALIRTADFRVVTPLNDRNIHSYLTEEIPDPLPVNELDMIKQPPEYFEQSWVRCTLL